MQVTKFAALPIIDQHTSLESKGALQEVQACLTRLIALGPYQFNWSIGESNQLASDRWLGASEMLATLRTPAAQRRPGDVYARLK